LSSKLIRTAIVALAMLWLAVSPAFAAISQNTIAPEAVLSIHGRHLLTTIQLACPEGERVQVRVRVDQAQTGAAGEGRTQGRCTGDVQYLTVRVISRGPISFAPGMTEACAHGVTRNHGTVTDERQWCREGGISLVTAN
jgi:hypothetical protein